MRNGIWMALALVACAGGSEADTSALDVDDDDTCKVRGESLPDLFADLDPGACEEALYFDQVPGATGYFVGEFELDGCGKVRGTETWILFANEKWIEHDGYDCRMVWSVSGTVGDPNFKGDYGLTMTAVIDKSATDCPKDGFGTPIYVGDTTMELRYDVEVHADGTSTVTFAESGNLVGEGYANAGHLNFASKRLCHFF